VLVVVNHLSCLGLCDQEMDPSQTFSARSQRASVCRAWQLTLQHGDLDGLGQIYNVIQKRDNPEINRELTITFVGPLTNIWGMYWGRNESYGDAAKFRGTYQLRGRAD
jgi:hypothetical protein